MKTFLKFVFFFFITLGVVIFAQAEPFNFKVKNVSIMLGIDKKINCDENSKECTELRTLLGDAVKKSCPKSTFVMSDTVCVHDAMYKAAKKANYEVVYTRLIYDEPK